MAKQLQDFSPNHLRNMRILRILWSIAIGLISLAIGVFGTVSYLSWIAPKVTIGQTINNGTITAQSGSYDRNLTVKVWASLENGKTPPKCMTLLCSKGAGSWFNQFKLSCKPPMPDCVDHNYQTLVAINYENIMVWRLKLDQYDPSGVSAKFVRMQALPKYDWDSIKVSPDCALIAHMYYGSITIEEATTGKTVFELKADEHASYPQCYFGANGELIVAKSEAHSIKLLEYPTIVNKPKELVRTEYTNSVPAAVKHLGSWVMLHYPDRHSSQNDDQIQAEGGKISTTLNLEGANWNEPMAINENGTILAYCQSPFIADYSKEECQKRDPREIRIVYLGNNKPKQSELKFFVKYNDTVESMRFTHDNSLAYMVRSKDGSDQTAVATLN